MPLQSPPLFHSTVIDNRFSAYSTVMSVNAADVPMVLRCLLNALVPSDDSDGTSIPTILHRTVAPLDLVPFLKVGSLAAPEKALRPFIPRPPSTLPEPGDLHVQLTFGEKIGSGRSSFVHEVNTTLPAHLPPLVLKVARSKRRAEIAERPGSMMSWNPPRRCIASMLWMVRSGTRGRTISRPRREPLGDRQIQRVRTQSAV
ncbi:hypothetical protein BS47DRAFT_581625 [Hydnum rufescens UP504]|uniref:Uncharacterized protein n=1 Tax=Hydnum rufescens UP504 TaxID=1448309 RepID=A0A9P6DKB9_9AGAM|nr:hypothetical protein BS47DRAFT_581625 [Hydnum rufescens UP504]